MWARMTGRDLRRRLDRDADALGAGRAPGPVVTDEQVAALPGSVRRYLKHMGVVGRPAVMSFRVAELDFSSEGVEEDPVVQAPPPRVPEWLEAMGGAAAVVAMLVGSPLLRGRYNRWGATHEECRDPMPGDDLVPDPILVSTRAITIAAPPGAVWPWLAQIGQGRGGLYSYDALENLVGLEIRSADRVLPEHREILPGGLVRLGKPGSPCFRVVSAEPGRSLVLISADPATEEAVTTPVRDGTGATWQWVLTPVRGGRATRLVSRQRNTHPPSQRAMWRVVEPIGFVMERRMLLGIKERAEHCDPAGG